LSKEAFLGIDIGTSGVKILVVEKTGNIIANHTEPLGIIIKKPGWAEQKPDDWWEATKNGLKFILNSLKPKNYKISSIGLSGQMHSFVGLNSKDQPVYNAILWNDGRTHEECKFIKEQTGSMLGEITGNPPLEGFTAPKMLWLKKHEPKSYSKITTVMMPKDYVRFMLTGEKFAEPTDASGTLLYDIHKNKWSKKLGDVLGIDISLFPKIINSTAIAGKLRGKIASELGLNKNIPIIAGGADNACASIGAGIIQEGSLMLTVGTSGAVVAPTKNPEYDPMLRVHLMRHVLENTWYKMGVILSAGAALDWWKKVSGNENFRNLIEESSTKLDALNQILFLPYLTGERTPHANPNARGVFFGLNSKTSRGDLTFAVLQGIALALKDSLNLIYENKTNINQAVLVGGGAKSRKWQQIISDALQLKLNLIGESEGASLGAAMLASCESKKYYRSLNEVITEWISVKGYIEPDHKKSDYYDELHDKYKNLYLSLVTQFQNLK
tara:strand:+ start:412 stop:1902 length:1491 start_codon:yes stop_codon:yes gene_type:complete